jgi:PAS domain S-box-containing protein
MRINTKLLINIFLPIAIMLLILLIMAESLSRRTEAGRKTSAALSVLSEMTQLNQRTYYFLLYREDRAKKEWFSIYAALADLTRDLRFNDIERDAVVKRIRDNLEEMRSIFSERITDKDASGQPALLKERQDRLSSQLLIRARSITSDAYRLYEMSTSAIRRADSQSNTLILLVLLLSVLITLSTLLPMNRKLSESISRLTAGAATIGAGNLDHKTGIATNDEIGQLSRAFDTMTKNLKALTVSRDELAGEVGRRRQVEDALRRSEAILKQAGQMARLGAWEIEFVNRDDSDPLRWSDEVYRIFGYEPGGVEVSNRLFFERVHPDDRDPIRRTVAHAIAHRAPYSMEHRIIRADGAERFVLEHAEVVYDNEGMPVRMIGAVQDVTERKEAELALMQSKHEQERYAAQLETVFNNLTDGLVVADLDGMLFQWNPAALAMHGFASHEEARRRLPELTSIFELSTPQDGVLPLERWPLARVLRGESLHLWEVHIRRRQTDWHRIFSYGGMLARDREGKPLMAVVIVRDITERKQREEEFVRISQQNELILEYAGEGIFGLDLQGKVTFVNARAAHMLGYHRSELMGSHSHLKWHYQRADGSPYPSRECPIYAAYDQGSMRSGEEVFWRKDGTAFPVDFTSRPLYEAGRIAGAVVIYRDITERKRAEEELKRLVNELERSNKELEQFAYVASHDLQEPLRMVSSYVQLLERRYRKQLDEKADRYIFFAVDGVQRMQKLIDGLLAYSRVARGAKFSLVDMNQAYNQAVMSLSLAIRESGAVITREELPQVYGDETQLIQVFQNLIGNAIKFQVQGQTPRVHVAAARSGDAWLFSVTDNGIGIDPQYAKRIFLIFQRLHSREEYPGTGIGLSLCKRIVERHGGRIWVESAPDQGTRFIFSIPMRG